MSNKNTTSIGAKLQNGGGVVVVVEVDVELLEVVVELVKKQD